MTELYTKPKMEQEPSEGEYFDNPFWEGSFPSSDSDPPPWESKSSMTIDETSDIYGYVSYDDQLSLTEESLSSDEEWGYPSQSRNESRVSGELD